MKDNEFKLLYFMMFAIFVSIMLTSSWESYLYYLNKKQIIEAIKDKDPKYINEQMQGLLNDIKK
jgi:hypothetical protein